MLQNIEKRDGLHILGSDLHKSNLHADLLLVGYSLVNTELYISCIGTITVSVSIFKIVLAIVYVLVT